MFKAGDKIEIRDFAISRYNNKVGVIRQLLLDGEKIIYQVILDDGVIYLLEKHMNPLSTKRLIRIV